MGTIRKSSSHSPFAAEAANGVRLLLFWPAAWQILRSGLATLNRQTPLFTAVSSGCPFPRLPGVPGRSVIQAYADPPRREVQFTVLIGPKSFVSCSPVTQSLKERFRFHRSAEHWKLPREVSWFRLRLSDAQTRGSDRTIPVSLKKPLSGSTSSEQPFIAHLMNQK